MSKDKIVVKQIILEAQAHRSRARVFSDRKSNRNRASRIRPNTTPVDVPAQSESQRDSDAVALKCYRSRFRYD